MKIFKAGALAAGGACALALVVGHGHLGAGFSRLGYDARATWANAEPAARQAGNDAREALGHAEEAALSGAQSARREAPAMARRAQSAGEGIAASARSAAARAQGQAEATLAAAGQRKLRAALMGSEADLAAPDSDAIAATLASGSGGMPRARQMALESTALALLRSSPSLRAAAIPGSSKSAASAGSPEAKARSAAAAAFSEAFATALCAVATPEQASSWGLPSASDLETLGLPRGEAARARLGADASAADPIAEALSAATTASRRARAAPSQRALGAPGWLLERAQPMEPAALAADAAAIGGAAKAYAASLSGATPAQIETVARRVKERRSPPPESPVPAADSSAPSMPL